MENQTSINQETLNDFFAPVKKVSKKELYPNMDFMSYNDTAIIMTKNGKDIVVNDCSKGYALIPNSDLFPQLEELLKEKGFNFTKTYKVRNEAEFTIQYRLIDESFIVNAPEKYKGKKGQNDSIMPLLEIHHSYNSRFIFNLNYGFFREICSNGMWGLKYEGNIGLSHSVGNIEKIFDRTILQTELFLAEADKLKQQYDELNGRIISNYKDRINFIMNQTGVLKSWEQEITELVETEAKLLNTPVTDWLIYNGFNSQLNHNEEITMSDRDKVKTDRKIFDFIQSNQSTLIA